MSNEFVGLTLAIDTGGGMQSDDNGTVTDMAGEQIVTMMSWGVHVKFINSGILLLLTLFFYSMAYLLLVHAQKRSK